MDYRPLGATGIRVSAIGFGTWGIGGVTRGHASYGPTDDTESLAALALALDPARSGTWTTSSGRTFLPATFGTV